MSTMGMVYSSLGLYKEAKRLVMTSLEIRMKTYGEESNEVAESYFNLSNISLKEGNFKEAEKFILKAIKIFNQTGRKDDEQLFLYYNNFGEALTGEHKLDEALELYNKLLKIKEMMW